MVDLHLLDESTEAQGRRDDLLVTQREWQSWDSPSGLMPETMPFPPCQIASTLNLTSWHYCLDTQFQKKIRCFFLSLLCMQLLGREGWWVVGGGMALNLEQRTCLAGCGGLGRPFCLPESAPLSVKWVEYTHL